MGRGSRRREGWMDGRMEMEGVRGDLNRGGGAGLWMALDA